MSDTRGKKKTKKRFLFNFFSTPTRLGFSAPSSIVVFMYFDVFLYSAAYFVLLFLYGCNRSTCIHGVSTTFLTKQLKRVQLIPADDSVCVRWQLGRGGTKPRLFWDALWGFSITSYRGLVEGVTDFHCGTSCMSSIPYRFCMGEHNCLQTSCPAFGAVFSPGEM